MSEEFTRDGKITLLIIPLGMIIYVFMVWNMFRIRDETFERQERYIKDYNCKLTETIPSHPVGMMIHGEGYIYTCPSGEKVRVN